MLRLENISVERSDFKITADITFNAGSTTALMGHSGSGKSTLLLAIAGFVSPTSGRLLYMSKDITEAPPHQRPVEILFQDSNLFPHLTVEQNLSLVYSKRMRPDREEKEKIEKVLEKVGLSNRNRCKPGQLSGGQIARAALARLLLGDRPIVLLDEPFSSLGPSLRAEMIDLTKEILAHGNRALILVTHDPYDALRLNSDLAFVTEGKLTVPRNAKAILSQPDGALLDYLEPSKK
jgi:thiamine transport system ATP-binding protein